MILDEGGAQCCWKCMGDQQSRKKEHGNYAQPVLSLLLWWHKASGCLSVRRCLWMISLHIIAAECRRDEIGGVKTYVYVLQDDDIGYRRIPRRLLQYWLTVSQSGNCRSNLGQAEAASPHQ